MFPMIKTKWNRESGRIFEFIYNRADAPICVLEEKYREPKKKLDDALKEFFGGKYHVEIVYKITPC